MSPVFEFEYHRPIRPLPWGLRVAGVSLQSRAAMAISIVVPAGLL